MFLRQSFNEEEGVQGEGLIVWSGSQKFFFIKARQAKYFRLRLYDEVSTERPETDLSKKNEYCEL